MTRKSKHSPFQAIMFFLGAIMALFWSVGRIHGCVVYNIDVEDRLKRASDANTVEIAEQELDAALQGIDKHNLETGYTSILYRTPDEDLGFWYKNIVSAKKELAELPTESSPLEKTNVLMKLRETLLDNVSGGMQVTAPDGISIHPYNTFYGVLGTLGWLFMLVFGYWWFNREFI